MSISAKCDVCEKNFNPRYYNLPFWKVFRVTSIRDILDPRESKTLDVCQDCVGKIQDYIESENKGEPR